MQRILEIVNKHLPKEMHFNESDIEIPQNPEMGDYALPCFKLSSAMKKSPLKIAFELQEKIQAEQAGHAKKSRSVADSISPFEKIIAKNAYLNFYLSPLLIAETAITNAQSRDYGNSDIGKNKTILLEHTSTNPNAPLHLGRARNSLIGDSVKRILKFQKFRVSTHFFVNDVGKQIAMLVIAVRDSEDAKLSFEKLLNLYISINKRAEEDPEIEKEAFELLEKFERGDSQTVANFRKVVDICIQGQKKSLADMDINFDSFDYESKYLFDNSTKKILVQLEKTGALFIDEQKRYVLKQESLANEMRSPVLVLTRNNKTSLYPLRDIAYTLEKLTKARRNILILGEDQKLYAKQVNEAIRLLGKNPPEVIHYSFVLLEQGKMSTRKGNLVLLDDFKKEIIEKADAELKQRYPDLTPLQRGRLAKEIAIGALKYSILHISPDKNVNFNYARALSFEGESAPYIQYAHARACSILRKQKPAKPYDFALLISQKEKILVKKISDFPFILEKAALELRPHLIAVYLSELAKNFNEFYAECQVISQDKLLTNSRLILVNAFKNTARNALFLLGINAPEKM